ncbi:MAG: hypothetical protein AB7Q23_17310 [Hyphomonadaceae bacterium]
MSDETAVIEQQAEPGGWLAEHQRAHCAGSSASDTFQGLIADEIFLPQSAADHTDPLQLVLACNAWTDALLNQAYFIPGEFAPEALWSFYAHDYLAQATAGGQAQYYALRGGDEIALRCTQSALKSMLADPHLEIFNLLVRLKRAKPVTARRIAAQAGYRNAAVALRDLDKRFAELEQKEPLTPRHKTWLKSLRKLKIVPDAEMTGQLNRVASVNRLRVQRQGEADAQRAHREQHDPAFRCVRRLCEMAGLRFAGLRPGGFAPMRSIWAEGPDRTGFLFRVETDRGPRAAVFYVDGGLFKRRMAVLLEQGGVLPIGSMEVSRGDYTAIVPGQ